MWLQTRADVREHGCRLYRLIETQQKHQRSIGTVIQALVIDGKQADNWSCEAEAVWSGQLSTGDSAGGRVHRDPIRRRVRKRLTRIPA
jgi:hypothetical protein